MQRENIHRYRFRQFTSVAWFLFVRPQRAILSDTCHLKSQLPRAVQDTHSLSLRKKRRGHVQLIALKYAFVRGMTFLMTLWETTFRNVSRLMKRVYCHTSHRMAAASILLLVNTIPQIVQCACSVAWISQAKIRTEWRSWMEMWSFSWVRYKFRETDPNNCDLLAMQKI